MADEDFRITINVGIFHLIRILGDGIHRDVEKPVDKFVDNVCKSSIVTILYLIA